MLDCLILGDSLAVGVGQIRKECVTHAKVGINSYNYVNQYVINNAGNTAAKTVIISLGSNDLKNINTFEELDTLRQLVKADRVYWIVPAIKKDKQEAVWAVADKYRDNVINSQNHEIGPDGVHPTNKGYKSIANQTQGGKL
jgi:lysophospholipase L1-like esterase